MQPFTVTVSIKDTEIFEELIKYLKEVILDERMPGDLANEMQDRICKLGTEETEW